MEVVQLGGAFRGRWRVQNSPANRVPSHGTHVFGTTYAIDFVPVGPGGRSAPIGWRSLVRPEPPETFVGFGREILAPVAGLVLAVHDDRADHDAHRGLPSVRYALTQRKRLSQGWAAVAGNYVVIQARPGVLVALCHLRQGSATVSTGQRVALGDPVGRCGNSGNSTEPHVHLQAIDRLDVLHASAVPITFGGRLPRNGEIVDAG